MDLDRRLKILIVQILFNILCGKSYAEKNPWKQTKLKSDQGDIPPSINTSDKKLSNFKVQSDLKFVFFARSSSKETIKASLFKVCSFQIHIPLF